MGKIKDLIVIDVENDGCYVGYKHLNKSLNEQLKELNKTYFIQMNNQVVIIPKDIIKEILIDKMFF